MSEKRLVITTDRMLLARWIDSTKAPCANGIRRFERVFGKRLVIHNVDEAIEAFAQYRAVFGEYTSFDDLYEYLRNIRFKEISIPNSIRNYMNGNSEDFIRKFWAAYQAH